MCMCVFGQTSISDLRLPPPGGNAVEAFSIIRSQDNNQESCGRGENLVNHVPLCHH